MYIHTSQNFVHPFTHTHTHTPNTNTHTQTYKRTYVIVQAEMPSFSSGDVVRMLGDMAEVYRLQQGHGDWNDDMALVRGTYCIYLHCVHGHGFLFVLGARIQTGIVFVDGLYIITMYTQWNSFRTPL